MQQCPRQQSPQRLGSVPALLAAAIAWVMAGWLSLTASTALAVGLDWQVNPDLTCLWRTCATFQPADGSPMRVQSWNERLLLDRPGRLSFPAGRTWLERPATQQVLEVGPGALLYRGSSSFYALQPLYMKYEHVGSQATPLQVLLPTLILGTEGTLFRVVPEGVGELSIEVTEGRVLYQWIDAPLTPYEVLNAGLMLSTSSLVPRQSALSTGTSKGVTVGARMPLSARALRVARQQAEEALAREQSTGRRHLRDEELVLLGSEVLTRWTADQQRVAAETLAAVHPDDPVAGRVVYQLWLQAHLTDPKSALAGVLEALLLRAFAQTAWPAAIEGILQREALEGSAPHSAGAPPL